MCVLVFGYNISLFCFSLCPSTITITIRERSAGRPVACMAVWLYGCMAVWLHGCMAVWLHGCMAVWLHGCMAAWLHGCMAAWLHGSMAAWLYGWLLHDRIQVPQ
jgi:hypothetical protein